MILEHNNIKIEANKVTSKEAKAWIKKHSYKTKSGGEFVPTPYLARSKEGMASLVGMDIFKPCMINGEERLVHLKKNSRTEYYIVKLI